MQKSGTVVKVTSKNAIILTPSGQYVNIKVTGEIPRLGQVYSGEVVK